MSGRRLLILGYHNVGPTWFWPYRPGRALDGLLAQVRRLRRFATILPLDAALADLRAGRPLPPRAVAITFDDGYRDNLTLAAPALARLDVPATYFLVPGFLDRSVTAWWEELAWAVTEATRPRVEVRGHGIVAGDPGQPALAALAEDLKRGTRAEREAGVAEVVEGLAPRGDVGTGRLFMDWDEARALRDVPGATIGSHSSHHAILAREPAAAQEVDLAAARRRLQDELEVGADLLAYPNGQPADADEDTVRAATVAGHTAAVTTVEGWNDAGTPPFDLRRFVLDPATGVRGLTGIVRAAGGASFLAGR